jgi:hypothetical protein
MMNITHLHTQDEQNKNLIIIWKIFNFLKIRVDLIDPSLFFKIFPNHIYLFLAFGENLRKNN